MGYQTSYSLKWECQNKSANGFAEKVIWDEISNKIKSHQENDPEFFYGVDHEGSCVDSVKWYEHETDVAEFSKNYPDVLFALYGEGEEQGDIWKKFFLNGKVQLCMAEIVFPEFDAKKLKEVDKN